MIHDQQKTIHSYGSQIFPQVHVRIFVVPDGYSGLNKVYLILSYLITRPLPNNILDLIATTNRNLVNDFETHTGISDHLVILDFCPKTKYQTVTKKIVQHPES